MRVAYQGPTLSSWCYCYYDLLPIQSTTQVKDIARATWTVFGKWGHLRIFLENNKSYRFDSFIKGASERLQVHTSSLSLW